MIKDSSLPKEDRSGYGYDYITRGSRILFRLCIGYGLTLKCDYMAVGTLSSDVRKFPNSFSTEFR